MIRWWLSRLTAAGVVAMLPLSSPTMASSVQTLPEFMAREAALNAGTEKEAFRTTLEGHRVLLKQTLYSLIDTDPMNPSIRFGNTKFAVRGVSVISPDKGSFLRDSYGSTATVDREPDRFLAKIGNPKASITSYAPGTPLMIRSKRGVRFEVDDVTIILIDELDGGGKQGITTALIVQWPRPFAEGFPERAEVETLVRQVLDFEVTQ